VKLSTSRYAAKKLIQDAGGVPVRTSIGMPRFSPGYDVTAKLMDLAPAYVMLKMPKDEYQGVYRARLERVGVDVLRMQMRSICEAQQNDHLIFLCFENLGEPGTWCHRRMFAEWWEEKTGEKVEELGYAFEAPAPVIHERDPQMDLFSGGNDGR
jgi:hypothetical protein